MFGYKITPKDRLIKWVPSLLSSIITKYADDQKEWMQKV